MCFIRNKEKRLEQANRKKLAEIADKTQYVIEKASATPHMASVALVANRIVANLNDSEIKLDKKQLDEIDRLLNDVKSHLSADYCDYDISKLEKIESYLNGRPLAVSSQDKASEANENRIYELEAMIKANRAQVNRHIDRLSSINENISKKEKLQNEALGDKATWKKYYFEINQLKQEATGVEKEIMACENQIKVLTQTIDTFRTQNLNISNSSVLTMTADMLKDLSEQKDLVDTALVRINAESNKQASEAVSKASAELNSIIEENFSSSEGGLDSEVDLAYERAVREAALEKVDAPEAKDSRESKEKK